MAIFAFVLGIVPGVLMFALNWERLGHPEKRKGALRWCAALALLCLLFVFNISILAETDALYSPLRILLSVVTFYTAIVLYHRQRSLFERFTEKGGRKAPIWKPLLWSALWMLVAGTVAVGGILLGDERRYARALTHMERNENDAAERLFQDLKTTSPEDPVLYWNLAVIYDRMERPDLARRELQQLLELDPTDQEAREYLESVEELLEIQ